MFEIGNVVIYYASGSYQVKSDGTHTNTRKYYSFGSTAVAMRENNGVIWLLQDQVNSTTITADANGALLSETRYSAFGEVRYTNGTTVTDKLYTGQQHETEIGLDYYVARFYDPEIAHFVQADSLVPEPGTLKAFDRYAYVNSNPIVFNDPSGNKACSSWDKNGNCVVDTDWQTNKNGKVATQSIIPTIYLYNTTGWGTGYTSEQGYADYNNQRPLSPLSESVNQRGGTTVWNGYVDRGDPNKDDLGQKIYADIVDKISENKNSKIYLVGHSAGTDAVIYALFLLTQNHPEMVKNIQGVAILDVQLADADNPQTSNKEITNEMGARVAAVFTDKLFVGYSADYYNEYYVKSGGKPQFLINSSVSASPYMNLDHYSLAVNPEVMQAIESSFGW